ncbi:MAG: hypothetical protein QF570_23010 [Myxococcota bacterium]|jgi:hypothetical protein|nr:hypothetical protein [Myxococcota bacterium]
MGKTSIAILLCLAFAAPAWSTEPAAEVVAIESVVKSVKQALVVAQSEIDAEELPTVKSAVLQLETLYSTRGDGRKQLVIAKAGAAFDRARAQKFVLDIKPPRARGGPVSARELEETLTQLIVTGARSAALVAAEPNSLSLTQATAQWRFVVVGAGVGGLGFNIMPLSDALEIAVDKASVQILTIGYEAR